MKLPLLTFCSEGFVQWRKSSVIIRNHTLPTWHFAPYFGFCLLLLLVKAHNLQISASARILIYLSYTEPPLCPPFYFWKGLLLKALVFQVFCIRLQRHHPPGSRFLSVFCPCFQMLRLIRCLKSFCVVVWRRWRSPFTLKAPSWLTGQNVDRRRSSGDG